MKQFEKIEVYKKIPLYEYSKNETKISWDIEYHILKQIFPNIEEVRYGRGDNKDEYKKFLEIDKLLRTILGTFEFIDEAVKHYPFLLDFVTPTHCEEKILADGLDVIEWAKNR